MLSSLLTLITLVAVQLLLLATNVHKVLAVSSVALGFCTDSRSNCEDKWQIFGDPSWDQAIQGTANNSMTGAKNEAVTCNSFHATSEYPLKLCHCSLCKGCNEAQCMVSTAYCTGSLQTSTFKSICAVSAFAMSDVCVEADQPLAPSGWRPLRLLNAAAAKLLSEAACKSDGEQSGDVKMGTISLYRALSRLDTASFAVACAPS